MGFGLGWPRKKMKFEARKLKFRIWGRIECPDSKIEKKSKNFTSTQNAKFWYLWNVSLKSGMGKGTGIPWNFCPGTWDRDWDWFSWDAWDWEKYRLDSPGTKNSEILAVPKSSHGTQIPETLGTGTKIVGTVQGFWALGLKSLGQKSLGSCQKTYNLCLYKLLSVSYQQKFISPAVSSSSLSKARW